MTNGTGKQRKNNNKTKKNGDNIGKTFKKEKLKNVVMLFQDN